MTDTFDEKARKTTLKVFDAWRLKGDERDIVETATIIAAALREAAGEWQPIETAPGNTPILAYSKGTYHGVPFVTELCPSDLFPDSPWRNVVTHVRLYRHAVTHWRPLPQPPED